MLCHGRDHSRKDQREHRHHSGRFNDTQKRPRTTIIRFTNRSSRDLMWRMAKDCSFLKDKKLRFTVDLTGADKEVRKKLWPLIETSRKNGKKAHFAGVYAIIKGKEIRSPPSQHAAISAPQWTDIASPP